MKQYRLLFIGYLAMVSFFVSCNFDNKNHQKQPKGNFRNPNEDSELTLLMRDVFEQTQEMKKAIAQGKKEPPVWFHEYLDKLQKVHNAQPSDSTVHEQAFYAFVDLLNENAHSLFIDFNAENYTQLVNSCVKCHQQYCPGPIVKIKKLYLK